MASPLGKYAQAVAAGLAVTIIVSWIFGGFLHGAGILAAEPQGLRELALLAAGAVFGAVATVNGVKADVVAAHKRLDVLGAPPAADGTAPPPVT